jgi:xanthine dehydrogenase YagR molybdenum-binding subunit
VATRGLVGDGLSADGAATPGNSREAFIQQSYGAHFAEVGVSEVTGEIRLRRMLGVFTAGRILNAKTARSQAIGGMTFGVGAALMEAIVVDKRDGWFVNNNLASTMSPPMRTFRRSTRCSFPRLMIVRAR